MNNTARAVLRQAKNYTKGYTDIQVKVREATSNDPWNASGAQMQEIADATYHAQDFQDVMDILDKRLNDSGKNWRHVFKALTVLDYLIHTGSEQVVAYAKQNLYVIKTLKEFQFIDEEGRDQGLNVREKSKQIAALLGDDDRLKEERRQRSVLRDRMANVSSMSGAFGAERPSNVARSFGAPSTAYEEKSQVERAIEESKRAAADLERRRVEKEKEERELQIALEISRREVGNQQSSYSQQQQQQGQQQQAVVQRQQSQAVDLWGAQDTKSNDLDFFASMAAPQPIQQTQPDPFGFGGPSVQQNAFASQQSAFSSQQQQYTAFANAPVATQQAPQFQNQAAFGAAPSYQLQKPFGGSQEAAFGNAGSNDLFSSAGGSQQNVAFGQPQQQQQAQQQNAFGVQGGANPFGFDAAFDTGAGQKNFVPRAVQGSNNPNAQLAHIARNAIQIDPFANLASQSNPAPLVKTSTGLSNTDLSFGNPSNNNVPSVFGGNFSTPLAPTPVSNYNIQSAQPQQQQQQPKNTSSDPFASLAPFPTKQPQPTPNLLSQQSNSAMGAPMMRSQSMQPPMGQYNPFGQQSQQFRPMATGFPNASLQQQQQQQQQPQQQNPNAFSFL